MFTGIIEEIGEIRKIRKMPGGKRLSIHAEKILDDLQVDHSISVTGVCLTVIERDKSTFTVEAVGETLSKSTLDHIHMATKVNLERAMQIGGRFGGHIVQGHVDAIGKVKQMIKRGDNWYLEIEIPEQLLPLVIKEGSIALDGVSLTIADINNNIIGISVIPHTYKNTTLSGLKRGSRCNLESDLIGKYIARQTEQRSAKHNPAGISMDWLHKKGY